MILYPKKELHIVKKTNAIIEFFIAMVLLAGTIGLCDVCIYLEVSGATILGAFCIIADLFCFVLFLRYFIRSRRKIQKRLYGNKNRKFPQQSDNELLNHVALWIALEEDKAHNDGY